MLNLMKTQTIYKIFSNTLINLPAPKNISYFWNMGSLLSFTLTLQILTGVLLASSYYPSLNESFNLTTLFMEYMDKTWLIRYMHSNGASMMFILMYIHIARNIYYNSYLNIHTWMIGVSIFLLTMITAFMGYILPANQMSYWGASVITNLLSEVPYIGPDLVKLIWGGSSVASPTMMRFFSFHFFLPFLILMLSMMHIMFLHVKGSSNPLGTTFFPSKIPFHKKFSHKDLLGLIFIILMFMLISIHFPLTLGDDENFSPANSTSTPLHIQPEWYFLFAYAILRSIPNKMGGILSLFFSVIILYFIPFLHNLKFKSTQMNFLSKFFFWLFSTTFILLTWIGMKPVEVPYIWTGQILTIMYFSYFLIQPLYTYLNSLHSLN